MEKKKLNIAFVFTIVICFLIILFEFFFLFFKYQNYKNAELQMLHKATEAISYKCDFLCNRRKCNIKILEQGLKRDFGSMKFRNFKGDLRGGSVKALKKYEFILFEKNFDYSISSFENKEFEKFLKDKLVGSKMGYEGNYFKYNGVEFIYNYATVDYNNKKNILLVFKYAELTISDVWFEFVSYLIFTLGIGVLLFLLLYHFVSFTLRPVEENIKDMEQFIHNAGHELKTPVSSAKSSLQVAQKTGDYLDSIDETVYELDRMASLIDSLIQLSTIKKNNNNQEFSVSKLIKEIIDNYKQEAEKKHIKLYFEKKEDFCLKVNPDYFRIFVSNFVSNAIRHNNNGSKVELTVSDKYLEIKDDGEGMDREVKEKMFERFFKGFEGRESQGFGIGLSLVKKIADIYGWKIQVESTLNKGTIFRIYF